MRFLIFACVLALAACNSSMPGPNPTPSPTAVPTPVETFAPGPNVPLFADLGKPQGDLSPDEVAYLASRFSIVALNSFGSIGPNGEYRWIEDSQNAQVAAIRTSAAAQGVKGPQLLAYVGYQVSNYANSYLAYQNVPDGCWITLPNQTKQRLNIEVPACASWWVAAMKQLVANGALDGLFVDGVNAGEYPGAWDDAEAAMFASLRAALPGKVLIANAEPDAMAPNGLNDSFDGTMTEPVDEASCPPNGNGPVVYQSPAQNLRFLKAGYAYAATGKLWIEKTWPTPGTSLCNAFESEPYAEQVAAMNAGIPWALALYAVASQPTVLLSYSWGYNGLSYYAVSGDPPTWSVQGYPLSLPYGVPSGPLVAPSACPTSQPGPGVSCVLSRPYAGGTVSIDLGSRTIPSTP